MPYGTAVSIAVAGGRIASIGTDAIEASVGVERIDLDGALVIPGLIDGHIHLDKTFVGDRWRPHRPCTSGFDVRERVIFEKELLADSAPAETRVASLIELAVSRGTTHMRSHVDVDSAVGLRNLETVCAARERYRDCVSIEIVAFPQSGIMRNPGTAELLDAAVREGADLVGGLDPAGFDKDIEGHLATVFGIAERRDVGIDLHLHDPDALGISELEAIAERTKALGMQGRVAVSHAYALGDVPIDTVKRTAAKLADAGVAIMTNAPGNRAFPPILALRDEGVTVFLGNDNIQDSVVALRRRRHARANDDRRIPLGLCHGRRAGNRLRPCQRQCGTGAATAGLRFGCGSAGGFCRAGRPARAGGRRDTAGDAVGLQIGTTCRLQRQVRGSKVGTRDACSLSGRIDFSILRLNHGLRRPA